MDVRAIWSLPLTVIGLLGSSQGVYAQSKITVGENIHVSEPNKNLKHDEVLGCSDPHHPDRLIVVSIVDRMDKYYPWTTAYVSFDGGRNWTVGVQSRPPNDKWSQDPTCGYGPDGTAYFAAVQADGDPGAGGENENTIFFRSPDGGRTWLSPSTVFGAFDRPFVSVDGTGGKYNGRIYVGHNGLGGIVLQRSLDEGQTFLGPVLRPNLGQTKVSVPDLSPNPANTVILSDGTVVSLFFEESTLNDRGFGTGKLRIVRSIDGGEHYRDEIKVAGYSFDRRGRSTIPNIAVDPGSSLFRDRLYAVWQGTSEDQPSEDAFISHSSDSGKTWSQPTQVGEILNAPNARAARQYQTTVAVNKDGVVGVMWYEGFETSTTEGYWVYFAASLDGGETWTSPLRVSEVPCEFGKRERTQISGAVDNEGERGQIKLQLWPNIWISSGHTAGLVADTKGIFHAFWIDNRTGISQLWTAPVTVSGLVAKNGAKELTNLDDLSEQVKLELTHANFDEATGAVYATVRLKNLSERTITGPLKLRITALRSDIGIPKLRITDNGLDGDGAILSLSEAIPGGGLKPNKVSAEKMLVFTLVDPQPFRTNGKWHTNGKWRLLTLKGRLLGKVQP